MYLQMCLEQMFGIFSLPKVYNSSHTFGLDLILLCLTCVQGQSSQMSTKPGVFTIIF